MRVIACPLRLSIHGMTMGLTGEPKRPIVEAKGMKRLWPEPRMNVEGARLIYMDPKTMNGLNMHLTERPKR